MDGKLQRHDLFAVGAREQKQFGHLAAQTFRHAGLALAPARLFPARPARILLQVPVRGVDRDPERCGQTLHDGAAFSRAGVGSVQFPCNVAHEPGLFGCKDGSHAVRLLVIVRSVSGLFVAEVHRELGGKVDIDPIVQYGGGHALHRQGDALVDVGKRILVQILIGQHGRAVRRKLGHGQQRVAALFVQLLTRGLVAQELLRFPV